ncbi:hypothetical protein BJY01DRAFT_196563 [Aspergillus pseudoustus]|uniref:Uncharacterized protein n=1 Tax=Aspergillus pseudoustus TaxID=1810923 RepID=A0ABR4KUH1_9EURO
MLIGRRDRPRQGGYLPNSVRIKYGRHAGGPFPFCSEPYTSKKRKLRPGVLALYGLPLSTSTVLIQGPQSTNLTRGLQGSASRRTETRKETARRPGTVCTLRGGTTETVTRPGQCPQRAGHAFMPPCRLCRLAPL